MKMLPAHQEIGENLGNHRDTLAAADRDAQTMDVGQVVALGPARLGLIVRRRQPDHASALDPALQKLGGKLGRDRIPADQLGQADQGVRAQVTPDDRLERVAVGLMGCLRHEGPAIEILLLGQDPPFRLRACRPA